MDSLSFRKLEKACGEKALFSILKLFTWAAQNAPSGYLVDLSPQEVEEISGWNEPSDEKGIFFEACIANGYLELHNDNTYYISNWAEKQPHLAYKDERSDRGRLSRLSYTNHEAYLDLKKNGRRGITSEEYEKAVTGM